MQEYRLRRGKIFTTADKYIKSKITGNYIYLSCVYTVRCGTDTGVVFYSEQMDKNSTYKYSNFVSVFSLF